MRWLIAAVAVAAGAVVVPGCGSGGGGLSAQRVDGALVPVGGWVCASRLGETVVVDLAVCNIPRGAKALTMGLKLADGTAVYAREVHVLPAPAPAAEASQELAVRFGRGADGPGGARPTGRCLFLQVHFDVPARGGALAGSVFSLVVGEPDSRAGCAMGLTTGVASRDGSPHLADHTFVWDWLARWGRPVPPGAVQPVRPTVRVALEGPLAAGPRSPLRLSPAAGPRPAAVALVGRR